MKRPNARLVYLFMTFAVGFLIALGFSLSYYETVTAGFSAWQLMAVGAAFSISRVLFEIPTGVVADLRSRRLSVVIGLALTGLAMLLEGLFPLFFPILLAQALWGLGYTFTSGAGEAWLSDEIGEGPANRLFLAAKRTDLLGNLCGILAGMLLGSFTSARVLILASGAGWLLLAALLALGMPEQGFRPASPEARTTFGRMAAIFRQGFGAVRRRPALLSVLGVTLFFSLTFSLDRLFTWHLVKSFPLPVFFGNNPLGFLGLLDLGGICLSILLTRAVEKRFALLTPPRVGRVMFALTLVTALSIALFGWASSLWLAAALFLVIYSLGEVSDPLLLAWMNQRLDPSVRATILSMLGQAESIGQGIGGLLVGLLASLLSVPLALLAVSGLLLPALGLIHRSNRLEGGDGG